MNGNQNNTNDFGREKDLEPITMPPEDAAWAKLISGAVKLGPKDDDATNAVLNALKLERSGMAQSRPEQPRLEQPKLKRYGQADWDRSLSRASQLREVDHRAVKPALEAVRSERVRVQHRRLVLNRAFAGFAAAAVIAGVLILRAPHSTTADPGDAYAVYQEASQGW